MLCLATELLGVSCTGLLDDPAVPCNTSLKWSHDQNRRSCCKFPQVALMAAASFAQSDRHTKDPEVPVQDRGFKRTSHAWSARQSSITYRYMGSLDKNNAASSIS